jgi:hypothetical protein
MTDELMNGAHAEPELVAHAAGDGEDAARFSAAFAAWEAECRRVGVRCSCWPRRASTSTDRLRVTRLPS